jgi:hypothetical protein
MANLAKPNRSKPIIYVNFSDPIGAECKLTNKIGIKARMSSIIDNRIGLDIQNLGDMK